MSTIENLDLQTVQRIKRFVVPILANDIYADRLKVRVLELQGIVGSEASLILNRDNTGDGTVAIKFTDSGVSEWELGMQNGEGDDLILSNSGVEIVRFDDLTNEAYFTSNIRYAFENFTDSGGAISTAKRTTHLRSSTTSQNYAITITTSATDGMQKRIRYDSQSAAPETFVLTTSPTASRLYQTSSGVVTSVTFNSLADFVDLEFSNGYWWIMSSGGVTLA